MCLAWASRTRPATVWLSVAPILSRDLYSPRPVDTCSVRRGTRLTTVKGARANAIAKRRIGGNGWIKLVGSRRRRYVNSMAIAAAITIYDLSKLFVRRRQG